jgi:hypothetical protein
MSSDETPKTEPTIEPTLTITDAPSIAPDAKPEAAAETIEAPIEAKIEPVIEPEAIAPKLEKAEPEAIEPKIEAAAPAPQIAPAAAIVPFRTPEAKAAKPTQARSTRFALLAACVAIAASFGAIGGSLGVAKYTATTSVPQTEAMTVAREHMAEEIKALKETVAQLRANTKSLNDNFAALKTSVTAQNGTQTTQIGKIAETLDRVEKGQAEQRKTVAAAQLAPQGPAALETTGSIAHQSPNAKQTPAPVVLGAPPTTLKPPVVQGWVLRRVYDGAALIEGRDGIMEVELGSIVPGLGRIDEIKRQDGRWVMMTSRGMVVGR